MAAFVVSELSKHQLCAEK